MSDTTPNAIAKNSELSSKSSKRTGSELNAEVRIYKITHLVTEIRQMLEASYRSCWVEAEISSLSRPASGHCYFSLKDDTAQIRCAMFKGAVNSSHRNTGYALKEGDLVRVRGKVSVYAARGDMQFIVQHVEPAGEGLLKRQFEQLKQQLSSEGLFNQEEKRVIPNLPKCIGIISSPTGAAINDILTTLQRRFPSIPVRIYPSLVQGNNAPEQLVTALKIAEKDQQCDVIILSRGGGSLEDLWAFNDETLARAIFKCGTPIVSAVGHEVDVSICDFVADIRAATPTAAAELVTPDQQYYINQLGGLLQRLKNIQRNRLNDKAQQVDVLARRVIHPSMTLKNKRQRLQELNARLLSLQTKRLNTDLQIVKQLNARISANNPNLKTKQLKRQLTQYKSSLNYSMTRTVTDKTSKLKQLSAHINAINPLAILERGYSVVATSEKMNQFITDAKQLSNGDNVYLKFSKGSASCVVENIDKEV